MLLVLESKRPSRITQLPLPIGNMKPMHEDVPISPNPKRESSIQTMDAMNWSSTLFIVKSPCPWPSS